MQTETLEPTYTAKDFRDGPRRAMVPRMWRLQHFEANAKHDGGGWHRQKGHRICERHRMLIAVSILHGHLWHSQHPRARNSNGQRPQSRPTRPQRVGHHRRWRLTFHWRQSPDTSVAQELRRQRSALQQRDLRPHKRPILAYFAQRPSDQVNPDGFAGSPFQSAGAWRWEQMPHSWRAPWTATQSTCAMMLKRAGNDASREPHSLRFIRIATSSTTARLRYITDKATKAEIDHYNAWKKVSR